MDVALALNPIFETRSRRRQRSRYGRGWLVPYVEAMAWTVLGHSLKWEQTCRIKRLSSARQVVVSGKFYSGGDWP